MGRNEKLKQKFRSYKFWVALSASVIIFVNALKEMFGFNVSEDVVEAVIMGFCGVLVAFGIVEKPTEKNENQTQQEPQDQLEKIDDKNNNKTDY